MFTYDINTDIGKVRREISDTTNADLHPGEGIRPDGTNFSDEDIKYYLQMNDDSITGAARSLLIVLATAYSTRATEMEFGPYRESYKDQIMNIRRQIAMMERRYEDEQSAKPRSIPRFSTTQVGIDFS